MPTALPWFMASHALKNKGKGETIQTSFIELDFHSNLLFKIIQSDSKSPSWTWLFSFACLPESKTLKRRTHSILHLESIIPLPFLHFSNALHGFVESIARPLRQNHPIHFKCIPSSEPTYTKPCLILAFIDLHAHFLPKQKYRKRATHVSFNQLKGWNIVLVHLISS